MGDVKEIPSWPELTFDEETHVYKLNGSKILPSVTTVMTPLSSSEYGAIDKATLNAAAARGTAVHNSIENWLKFGIEDLEPEFAGYMEAFKKWWEQDKPELVGSEIRIYHRLMEYAGTADLIAYIDKKLTLVDFKTTSRLIDKNCRVQLEAYAQALSSHGITVESKKIVHLKKDGTWKAPVFEAKDPEAWRIFGSCKSIYDYLR